VLLGNCVIELCVRHVTGELRYRIVCEACYWVTALYNCGGGALLGNCVIELCERHVTGELRYRIVCEACYWGTAL